MRRASELRHPGRLHWKSGPPAGTITRRTTGVKTQRSRWPATAPAFLLSVASCGVAPDQKEHPWQAESLRGSFGIGEILVSDNGRFRLYLSRFRDRNTFWARLVLLGYAKDHGKMPVWVSESVQGRADTLFQFQFAQRGASTLHGITAFGSAYHIITMGTNYSSIDNSFLTLQDDGNLVIYSNFRGHRLVQWPSGTWNLGPLSRYVQPNTQTVEITAGTVAISGPSDGDIVNKTGGPIGVSDGNTYTTVPNTGSVPVAGTVHLDLVHYDFGSLEPVPAQPTVQPTVRRMMRNAADADPFGGRFTITITPGFGLRLFSPIDSGSEGTNEGVDLDLLRREYGFSDATVEETKYEARPHQQ